jgi:hypothetical protein
MSIRQIRELYYITPIINIPSIMDAGILSHNGARSLRHIDISMNEIQARRANKRVPNGLALHDYANLYFDAHNPMLSKRRDQNSVICILRINPAVLNLPGVVMSDRNASSSHVKFLVYPDQVNELDFDRIFAKYWLNQNQFVEWENKFIKCAEVLVPQKVPPEYVLGALVANSQARTSFKMTQFNLPVKIRSSLFF